MAATPEHPGLSASFPVRVLAIVVGIVLSLGLLSVGEDPATTGLDPSWSAVMGWAAAHGKQFGTDIVFTYGPLGFLHPGAAYYPDTYRCFLIAQLMLASACAYPLAICLARATAGVRLALLAVYLVWLPWIEADAVWLLFFAASMVVMATERDRAWPGVAIRAALFGVTAAALSLIKFTNLPVAFLAAILVVVWVLLDRRRLPLLGFALALPVALVAMWLSTGQDLSGFGAYVSSSLDFISGYSAMSLAPPLTVDILGTALLLVSGLSITAIMLRSRGLPTALAVFFLGCALFLSWRGSFSRADAHINQFIPVAGALPLYALIATNGLGNLARRWWALLLTCFTIPVGWTLLHGDQPMDELKSAYAALPARLSPFLDMPGQQAQRQAQWQQAASRHALPKFARLIGKERVDLLTHEQGVLLVNGFEYAPRPVIQSYSAYTPELQQRNLEYFQDPSAARWVILKLRSIDGRLPTLDDATALIQILRTYKVVGRERDYLLLRRDPVVPDAPAFSGPMPIGLNAWHDLPPSREGELWLARLHVQPTLLGRLYGAVLRESPLSLDLEQSDGRTMSFRLPPRMAQAGFIISPVLRSNHDLLRALSGARQPRTTRFRIRTSDSRFHESMFAPTGTAALARTTILAPDREALEATEAWTAFGMAPGSVEGEPDFITEGDRPVVFLHAPAALTFTPKPGRYRGSIGFGIREAALTSPNCTSGEPDGVRLAVYSAATNELIGARVINPFANPGHAGHQTLELAEFDLPERGIVVRLEPGIDGAGSRLCDWSYLDGMSLTPVTLR